MSANIIKETIINRPSKGRAILGDLAGSGEIIPCEELYPVILHKGLAYEYCGTMDGTAIYKRAVELRELEAEQARRHPNDHTDDQITRGD